MSLLRKCIDCGFWLSFYSCRACGKPLCGVCSEWPSSRLHSPGKGGCEACREKPLAIDIKWPLRSNVISLNHLLLSMGHEPVPNGGQSNKATLTLMKSIEEEIAERKKRQADYEDMLFAAADWRME